ncbi:MAG: hypothetical protein GY757_05010, partial [bacterium]|nr:hypothetical protein [bacterium]
MNKIIIILIVMSAILLSPQYSYSDDFLKETIAAKNWDALAPQFLDDSHTLLKNYFTESKSIKFISYQANKLTYKVKFKNQGELGSIVFKKKNNKYSEIEIKNQIKPLYYIESFKKYKVAGTKCSIGDAEIHFISGHIYQSAPNDSLLLFKGKWKFYIKPNDDEEKLTLKRLYNKDFISRLNNTGIFIMENKDFLKKLTLESESCSLDFDLQPLFDLFNNRYGIKISQYNEYWYLPFPDSSNLAILAKDSKSFYFYSYGAELSPDTQLIDSQSNMIVLNYNHEKGLRLLFGSKAAVEGMQMNCTFDPTTHFISGTTTLSYNREASLRTLNMEERLRLVGNLNLESKGLTLFRQGKKYYLMGAEGKKLSLFFSGYLKPTQERMELFKSHDGLPPKIRATDPRLFYFLSNTQNFYP